MADNDVWWSLQPFLDDEDAPPVPPGSRPKFEQMVTDGLANVMFAEVFGQQPEDARQHPGFCSANNHAASLAKNSFHGNRQRVVTRA